MIFRPNLSIAASLVALALLTACGGKDSASAPKPAGAKRLAAPLPAVSLLQGPQHRFQFTLVNNGPVEGLREMNVTIRSAAFQNGEGQWCPVPLPATAVSVDLLNSAPIPLAVSASLPKDRYSALRLTFDDDATLKLADGTQKALHLSREFATKGIALEPSFTPDGQDLWLVLDLLPALDAPRGVPNLLPGKAQLYDKAQTTTLTGVVLDQATQAPLAGVAVWAQSASETLIRQTVTDAKGHFTLALLPPGNTRVVTQPVLGERALATTVVLVKLPLPTGRPEPLVLACAPCPAPGEVRGLLPQNLGPGRSLVLELMNFPEDGGAPVLVRRTLAGAGDTTYGFRQVPPGRYRLRTTPSFGAATHTSLFQVTGATHQEDL